MNPIRARNLGIGLTAAAVLLMLLGLMGDNARIIALGIPALILLAVAAVVQIVFFRCPHCGKLLGRNWGDYCQYCGNLLTEEQKL